jgi:hypothetical protein
MPQRRSPYRLVHKVMITYSMTDIFVKKLHKILHLVICGLCVLQVSCPFSNSHKNLATIITWWTPSTFVVLYDISRKVIHVLLDLQSDVNTNLKRTYLETV